MGEGRGGEGEVGWGIGNLAPATCKALHRSFGVIALLLLSGCVNNCLRDQMTQDSWFGNAKHTWCIGTQWQLDSGRSS